MARASTITRLFVTEPEREPVKTDIMSDSQPDVVAAPSMLELQERSLTAPRRRFARRREGPESYTLDRSTILSMVDADVPPDRAGAFAELAQRDRLAQAMRRLAARGRAGNPPGAIAIQT
jgi:hypothetical protein